MLPQLEPTRCALCATEGNSRQLYPPRLSPESFTARTFSARRRPDRIHFRMVTCLRCGLIRSDPALPPHDLADLYRESTMDYGPEIPNIRRTYGEYLERAFGVGQSRESLLEIGCGNGFFLEEALARGFRRVRGIEPSADAIAKANPSVRPLILCDSLRPGLLEGERFGGICMFQVIDHLSDPAGMIALCAGLLDPEGRLLIITHDAGALSAHALGERSPIVDVEHTYLFGRRTLALLLKRHGLEVLFSGSAWNRYSLAYLLRLASPRWSATRASNGSMGRWLARIQVRAPIGNLFMVARRPAGPAGAFAGSGR